MSDETADHIGNHGGPSDAPRPVLIVIAVLALVALAAELYVGIVSAFAPTIAPQVATAPSQTPAPATPPQQTPQEQATPAKPSDLPTLPVQVPPTGG
jgi:hypothetical protein